MGRIAAELDEYFIVLTSSDSNAAYAFSTEVPTRFNKSAASVTSLRRILLISAFGTFFSGGSCPSKHCS